MDKISLERVCRQVVARQAGAIDYALLNEMDVYPYSLQDFEMDMLADDFISSRTTVMAKWRMLQASGVVTVRAGRSFLAVGEVRSRAEPAKRRATA